MSELDPEDQARADFYGLLARLFYSGPDAALLAAIAGADEIASESDDAEFARAWRALMQASGEVQPADAGAEFDLLFVGTGKAPVTPYLTHYLVPTGREKLLVKLRDTLAQAGLARRGELKEPEDHVAGIFDAMRHLTLAGSGALSLTRQRDFFERFIAPAYEPFLARVEAAEAARFYRFVAAVARPYLSIERETLAMV